jgi:hypothetical protein
MHDGKLKKKKNKQQENRVTWSRSRNCPMNLNVTTNSHSEDFLIASFKLVLLKKLLTLKQPKNHTQNIVKDCQSFNLYQLHGLSE